MERFQAGLGTVSVATSGPESVGVSCSIGIAEWDGHESAEALLARADAALYRAKRAGRGRVEEDAQADETRSVLTICSLPERKVS